MNELNNKDACKCACHTHKLAKDGFIHDSVCCDNLNGSLEWRVVKLYCTEQVRLGRIDEVERFYKSEKAQGIYKWFLNDKEAFTTKTRLAQLKTTTLLEGDK